MTAIYKQFARQFLFALVVAFSMSASVFAQTHPLGINPPDYLDIYGIAVYEVGGNSTDSSYDRANQANVAVNAGAYGNGYNFWARFEDGVYERYVTGFGGFPESMGQFRTSLEYAFFTGPDVDLERVYLMCGDLPRIIFHGYWQNWTITVGGIPFHGSDFEVTEIETTDQVCTQGGFPGRQ